jgi:hypothetical protein
MTDEHLRELKRQTRMMAERSAIKTLMACYFAFQMAALLAAIYWPARALNSQCATANYARKSSIFRN